jgi:hypothetical protein
MGLNCPQANLLGFHSNMLFDMSLVLTNKLESQFLPNSHVRRCGKSALISCCAPVIFLARWHDETEFFGLAWPDERPKVAVRNRNCTKPVLAKTPCSHFLSAEFYGHRITRAGKALVAVRWEFPCHVSAMAGRFLPCF